MPPQIHNHLEEWFKNLNVGLRRGETVYFSTIVSALIWHAKKSGLDLRKIVDEYRAEVQGQV